MVAAYDQVADSGFERLAVEALARRLGTTKGSFYWHFKDRAALLDAVLAHWEEQATLAVSAEVEALPEPDRLRGLLEIAFRHTADSRAEAYLLAGFEHPQVGPVVRRVHAGRIPYIHGLMVAGGLPADRADSRARILYAAYLGLLQLVQGGSLSGPDGVVDALLDELARLAEAE